MPLYSFECPFCGKIKEVFFRINSCPKAVRCNVCDEKAKKIMMFGGIQRDVPVWLPSASKVLVKQHERPIETRGEYKKYLKDNHLACKG